MPDAEQWFLSSAERNNPATQIDRRHPGQLGWTTGNAVEPLAHGRDYFARLHEQLTALGPGDRLWFLDWRGDADQRLAGPGTELGAVLTAAIRRGVEVRGLVWRSHPDQEEFSEQENAHLARQVNAAGGSVLVDERVRRFGAHHQKLVVLDRASAPAEPVGYVGGIDLCRGRFDDAAHRGDPLPVRLDPRYGANPAWHDVQFEVRGPAVADLAETFRERWFDPAPLDHRNPLRALTRRRLGERAAPPTLAEQVEAPWAAGRFAVQVLRTYPAKRPPYPFAPRGERSVAGGLAKAVARARSLIYVEDQYLWSAEVAEVLASALRQRPELRLVAVLPRYPDRDGRVSGPLNRIGQLDALALLQRAGGPRVGVYDLENEAGRPIYVHAKLCIVDDVWLAIGSANLNRRSWTHDSETSCAVLDPEPDGRPPVDPAGLGDGARALPRRLRLELWREHLGPGPSDEELLDPAGGFTAWRRAAAALDGWHAAGQRGPRPPGRARLHQPTPVGRWTARWARPAYRLVVDPDGRPRDGRWALRRKAGQ